MTDEKTTDDPEIQAALDEAEAAAVPGYCPPADDWMRADGPRSLPDGWEETQPDGTVLTKDDLIRAAL